MRNFCGFSLKTSTLIFLYSELIPLTLHVLDVILHSEPSTSATDARRLGVYLASMIACVMGLYAVSNRKSVYLVPYIIMRLMRTIPCVAFLVVAFISIALRSDTETLQDTILSVIPDAIDDLIPGATRFWKLSVVGFILTAIFALDLYVTGVVVNYYIEIRNSKKQTPIPIPV